MRLTDLERAILGAYHDAYGWRGFPPCDQVSVMKRERTERGVFVYLVATGPRSDLPDWECYLPNRQRLQVLVDEDGVELAVNLFMLEGLPATLEVLRANGGRWSGAVDNWRLTSVLLVA